MKKINGKTNLTKELNEDKKAQFDGQQKNVTREAWRKQEGLVREGLVREGLVTRLLLPRRRQTNCGSLRLINYVHSEMNRALIKL